MRTRLALILVLVMTSIAQSSIANPPPFLFSWDAPGVQDISIDGFGNVYTLNQSGGVVKYSDQGSVITTFEVGIIGNNSRITTESDGSFFVSNQFKQYILSYDSSGAQTDSITIASSPADIVSDRQGHLYIARGSRIDKVQVASGNTLFWWGASGSFPGFFDPPLSLTVDGFGDVHVVDKGNQRIQKFSSQGQSLLVFDGTGNGYGGFQSPQSVAVSPDGTVFVTDTGLSNVQAFSSQGNFLTQWGSVGSADGLFVGPIALDVGPNGYIYVADSDRIQVFGGLPLAITAVEPITWGKLKAKF